MNDTLERKRSIEEDLKNRETWLIVVEVTTASVLVISALMGNIILCLAIHRLRALRKIQNYYIVALAISDFLLTFLSVSLGFVAMILGRWVFGDTICQIQGSLIYYFASFSLLNMMLIAFNRYVKMVRSASIYQKIYTKKNVLLSIASCGIFSGVFIVPFVTQTFCFHPGSLSCFVCKSGNKNDQILLLSSYSVLISMAYPVMIFCYYKVFRKVRAHFAQIADSTLHEDTHNSFTEEVKITKILFAVLIAFLICWTPGFTIEFLDILQGEYTLHRQVYLILTYTGAANGAINPVIYGLMQKRFREAYKKVLTCDN
ncbi:melatonin receptor [Desmophyllum pertusum]|uniref:Melatonin receptor n=1 Tax=Desmophyllum pertusum TaxID=174260 RepID=A0A9W9YYS7_9CNID|nr:melatonin receptor [Desmophyllum pertusum]